MLKHMDIVHWTCIVGGVLLAASVADKYLRTIPGAIIVFTGLGIGLFGTWPIVQYFSQQLSH